MCGDRSMIIAMIAGMKERGERYAVRCQRNSRPTGKRSTLFLLFGASSADKLKRNKWARSVEETLTMIARCSVSAFLPECRASKECVRKWNEDEMYDWAVVQKAQADVQDAAALPKLWRVSKVQSALTQTHKPAIRACCTGTFLCVL